MIKRFYKFLHNHPIGTIRFLYICPIVAVVLDILFGINSFFNLIILFCATISITIQIGNDQKWYSEINTKGVLHE